MSKKLYQIKTITSRYPEDFDGKVNAAIRNGWFLENRYSAPLEERGERYPVFIADLRRYEVPADEPEAITFYPPPEREKVVFGTLEDEEDDEKI